MLSILTICVTLLVLGLLVAVILRRNLTPLGILAAHMAESRGVPAPVSLTGSTEIEKITTAYNQMTSSINDHVEKLHQAHEQQRKMNSDFSKCRSTLTFSIIRWTASNIW